MIISLQIIYDITVRRSGDLKFKLNIKCMHCPQRCKLNNSFHVVAMERTKKAERCTKMKNARAKHAALLFFANWSYSCPRCSKAGRHLAILSFNICFFFFFGSAGDNVLLVESRTHVKLADFGLARKIQVSKCAHTGGRLIILFPQWLYAR